MQQGHSSLVGPHVDALVNIASGSLELLGTPTWACLKQIALQLEDWPEFVGIRGQAGQTHARRQEGRSRWGNSRWDMKC